MEYLAQQGYDPVFGARWVGGCGGGRGAVEYLAQQGYDPVCVGVGGGGQEGGSCVWGGDTLWVAGSGGVQLSSRPSSTSSLRHTS